MILGKNRVESFIELELDPDDKIRFDESQKEVDTTLKFFKKTSEINEYCFSNSCPHI